MLSFQFPIMVLKCVHRGWNTFLFEPMAASGFRLMRWLWAAAVLIKMLPFGLSVLVHFGDPQHWGQVAYAHPYRWSLLFLSGNPVWILTLYTVLICACVAVILNLRPHIAVVVAFILFASFTERNLLPFHSEGQMLCVFGLLLTIWSFFPSAQANPPTTAMPAMLRRLLIWQVVVIYVFSAWYKILSPHWMSGAAVGYSLTYESLFPALTAPIAQSVPVLMKLLTFVTFGWEASWILLLVPKSLWSQIGLLHWQSYSRRGLIIIGCIMHVAWGALLKDVYPLSFAMIAAYGGLLTDEDRILIRKIIRLPLA